MPQLIVPLLIAATGKIKFAVDTLSAYEYSIQLKSFAIHFLFAVVYKEWMYFTINPMMFKSDRILRLTFDAENIRLIVVIKLSVRFVELANLSM